MDEEGDTSEAKGVTELSWRAACQQTEYVAKMYKFLKS